MYVYVPQLQFAQGLIGYLQRQLGLPIASTAPLAKITDAFSAAVHRFARVNGLPWVDFAKGQRKDDVMHQHLAEFTGTEGVLFVGRAQEKTALFRTEKRRDAHGDSYPWIVKTTGLVNQFYFEQAATVTCPGGHARTMTAKRSVTFGAVCAQCPLQARCTTANDGRSMSIHPHEQLLREARTQVRTPEFQEAYPTRSRVERIVAFTATNHGRRIKLRYLGVDKNHAWLRLRCAAINLRTLINSGLTRADGA